MSDYEHFNERLGLLIAIAIVLIIVVMLASLTSCGAIPPVQEASAETEVSTDIESGGDTEVETLTKQDLSQAQQSLEQKLVESVEEIGSLVQNVTSTVRNYGLSPEDRQLWEKWGGYGIKAFAWFLSAALGWSLILAAAPSLFKRETVKLAAYILGALLMVGPLLYFVAL